MPFKYFTILIACLLALLIAFTITLDVLATGMLDPILRDFMGEAKSEVSNSGLPDGVDPIYNKTGFKSVAEQDEYRRNLVRQVGADGYVLLKNEDSSLPLKKDKTLSLFSHSSVAIIGGGSGSGNGAARGTFKDALEAQGYTVNDTLWNFYSTGAGSKYTRGPGSISFGNGGENWAINECPLSVLQSNNVLSSANGTKAVFVISRMCGEGRDLARYMGKYTNDNNNDADDSRHYLEPDSVELGILEYLNENFDDVTLIVNTSNAFELGWIADFPKIKSVLWAPGGGGETYNSLADVLSGKVNPSAHLVDTFAYDAFSSPAMTNMGDFEFVINGSTQTGYYGVSYDEGIYVGYKYYETRYFDKVMEQGNAGNYNYADTVQYPFGYGLSYTDFTWSEFNATEPDDNGEITVSVKVSNKSVADGGVAGRDVVQVYLNAPYTDYDKQNHLEKSATTLVGFGKTGLLAPGASETVYIKINLSDFTVYDDVVAKTYILEGGQYLVTAAQDANEATNNFLANNGKVPADGMTKAGKTSFVKKYTLTEDRSAYSKSKSGADISNRFGDDGNDAGYIERDKYLSRNDWTGTLPVRHGVASDKDSEYSELNGKIFFWEVSQDFIDKLKAKQTSAAANQPMSDADAAAKALEKGKAGDLQFIDFRGKDFDDPLWDELISQITAAELKEIINYSGYATAIINSINKPKATDLDGPSGLNNMVGQTNYTLSYPSEVNIAASWDGQNSYNWGYSVAEDGLLDNIHASGWYAPAMNIHRTPFAGRNFEYFSEDSYISGIMGTEAVKGAASKGMYSFIKHFALNDQETHRDRNGIATFANEQTMREIYLKPFQMVMENSGTVETRYYEYSVDAEGKSVYTEKTAQTPASMAVMSSFNRIGYTWAGGDWRLLTAILRNEWDFNGIVLTDYSQGGTGWMHNEQMIRAGGDAALSQMKYIPGINITDGAVTYYAQQAMKHVLYTVVNSNAMNGYVHGVAAAGKPFANYYIILIVEGIVAAGLLAWGVTAIVLRWKKEKQTISVSGNSDSESGGSVDLTE